MYTERSKSNRAPEQLLGQACIQDTLSSRLVYRLHRPSASREQRYLAYKGQARAIIGYGAFYKYNYKGRPPKSRKSVFQISNVPNTAGFGCNLCAPLFGNKADVFCRAAICTVPSAADKAGSSY